jgi:hypothetical protein
MKIEIDDNIGGAIFPKDDAETLISEPILVKGAPEGETMDCELEPISSEDREEISRDLQLLRR